MDMRTLAPFALMLLAGLSCAQDSIKFTAKTDGTAKSKFDVNMTFDIGGMTATLATKFNNTTTYGAEKSSLKMEWEGFSLEAGGSPMDIPTSPIEVTLGKDGLPSKIEGGIEGSDQFHTFMTGFYLVPTEEAKRDVEMTAKIPANEAAGAAEIVVTTTYKGADKLDEKDAYKFEIKMKQEKTGFEVVSTYWLNPSGELMKLDGKYSNLQVPAAGGVATGTVKIKVA